MAAPRHCLESKVRLCDSILWRLQGFFEAPSFNSSNAKLAKDYARVIFHFLRDAFSPLGPGVPDGPCLLLEIGGGPGRFTYLLLKSLLEFQPFFESLGLPSQPFVYVSTDASESNLESRRLHPDLTPFIDAGWLDFAGFDANDPPGTEAIKALACRAGCNVGAGIEVPTVVICNGVLSALRQEAFQFGNEEYTIREGLVSVYSAHEALDPHDPSLASQIALLWDWENSEELTRAALAFDCPELGASSADTVSESPADTPPDEAVSGARMAILKQYLGMECKMTAVLPTTGFHLVDDLRKIAGNRLVMLIGDKGHQDISELDGWHDPVLDGTFAMPVNFHAIRLFFEHLGGFCEHIPYHDVFQVGIYALGLRANYPSLVSSLVDCRNDLGPGTMMFWSRHIIKELESEEPKLSKDAGNPLAKVALALLRYGGHDPELFMEFQLLFGSHLNARGVKDLVTDMSLVYKNRFDMHGLDQRDLPLAIAECLLRAGNSSEATEFFQRSIADHGPCAEVYVQLSRCYHATGRVSEALEATQEALRLSPGSVQAERQLQSLETYRNSLGTCLVGGGPMTLETTGPLLVRSPHFHLKAVFAFSEEEARRIADAVERWHQMLQMDAQHDGPTHLSGFTSGHNFESCRPEVIWGSHGLQDLLRRDDLVACVVDMHHKLLPALLPKLWAARKHVLSQSPLAYNLVTARDLMQSYQASVPPGSPLPAWHVIEAARHEDALTLAAQSLETVGRALCISVVTTCLSSVGGAGSPPGAPSHVPPEEEMALELVHCLAVVQKVTKDRLVSISVLVGGAGSEAAQAASTEEDSSLVQKLSAAAEEGSVRETALVGHFTLQPPPPTSSANSTGTFVVCRTGSAPGLEMTFHCARGALVLTKDSQRSAWVFRVTTDQGGGFGRKSLERSVPLQGDKVSHEAFFKQVQQPSGNGKTDVSVDHALADTAYFESIMQSMRLNGAFMALKYAN